MIMARSVQRKPFEQRWQAEGLQAMDIPCQQLYDRRAARAVPVEDFVEDPNAKEKEATKGKIQRVWIYEDDYKTFGITDDCKKCLHNQRWGYNASRMIHSEKCRQRMEEALATTEAGRIRLAAAEERVNQKLAKGIEEADARPERGIEAVGPDGGLESDFFAESVRGALTQHHETSTLGLHHGQPHLSRGDEDHEQTGQRRKPLRGRARDTVPLWRGHP
jgi:hypothetical protein